jgi:hypothetical protein
MVFAAAAAKMLVGGIGEEAAFTSVSANRRTSPASDPPGHPAGPAATRTNYRGLTQTFEEAITKAITEAFTEAFKRAHALANSYRRLNLWNANFRAAHVDDYETDTERTRFQAWLSGNPATPDVAARSARAAELSAEAARNATLADRAVQAERPRRRAPLPRQVILALATLAMDGLACYFAAQGLNGSQDTTLMWTALFLAVLAGGEVALGFYRDRVHSHANYRAPARHVALTGVLSEQRGAKRLVLSTADLLAAHTPRRADSRSALPIRRRALAGTGSRMLQPGWTG